MSCRTRSSYEFRVLRNTPSARLSRAEKFRDFALANPIRVPKGFRFSRAEANERLTRIGCHEIVSEDLSSTQLYEGMAIVNPFKRE